MWIDVTIRVNHVEHNLLTKTEYEKRFYAQKSKTSSDIYVKMNDFKKIWGGDFGLLSEKIPYKNETSHF